MGLQKLVPAAIVSALGMLPWMVLVGVSLGWGPILRGFLDHSAGGGKFPLTAPATLAFYLTRWMGWPTLALALFGLILILLVRDRAGAFLWLANSVILVGALFYLSFPRLILPAVLGLCLSAGYALSVLASLVKGRRSWVVAIALTPILVANFRAILPMLGLRTDCYRVVARFLEDQSPPVLTQMSKNFYFYGERPFIEMRFQTLAHLDELEQRNGELIVAFDPIIERFPELRRWVETRKNRLILLLERPIQAYEPIFFQGIDPLAPRAAPRNASAFAPSAVIRVFRLRQATGETPPSRDRGAREGALKILPAPQGRRAAGRPWRESSPTRKPANQVARLSFSCE